MDRLEKSLSYLHWSHIAGAVLDVFLENQERQSADPLTHKASADVWGTVDALRLEVWHRARHFWAKRTGFDCSYYPYSVDGTARLYFRFRKRNADEVLLFKQEIDPLSGSLVDDAPLFAEQET